ncbi:hypothetical protein HK100_012155 [Physocladia obscura]|uniref:Nucleolar 27S pre-rRNA processing Urb2/Npa2 C-terminal domain-containing protein n=1 Tax=Physocladia obscura TaxID=109957 RepID=A0AAD5T329_9FUNG|nr:hypothetical protein HK100_012155 [Physocladia obscura]
MSQKSSPSVSSSASALASTPIFQTNLSATVRPFSKHAGFLLSEFVVIQASSSPVAQEAVKKALLTGIYSLIDLCGEFGRNAVLAGLDAQNGGGGARMVCKELVSGWEQSSYRHFE